MDVLSTSEQKTLMKRFVSTALWPMVELNSADSMEMMVRKWVSLMIGKSQFLPEKSSSLS